MYNAKEKSKDLARKIKQLCETRGTTPYKIAKDAGLSTSTVSCFLQEKTIPRMDTVLLLCNQLDISITELFEETTTAERHSKEEETVLEQYRNLSETKRNLLEIYLKMLAQYEEE